MNKEWLSNAAGSLDATERETMKQMIRDLDRKYKGLKHRIFTAVERGGLFEQQEER